MKQLLLIIIILFYQNSFCQIKDTKIWKIGYSHLPFWDSTMSHGGELGYIDTFTINNTKFRIIHNDTLFDGTVQVYKLNKWINNIVLPHLGGHNDYSITNDLDGDNNIDLILFWKWDCEVYFFDKKTNLFSDTVNSSFGYDWHILDSEKHIYFENEFWKLEKSPVFSNLYTFKNKKRVELASLEMIYNTNDDDNYLNLKKCRLYNSHHRALESFMLTNKTSIDEYDLDKYWKSKLKKILDHAKH